MTDIQGLVFDKDGTLFDFEATWTPWATGLLLHLCQNDRSRAKALGLAVGFDLDAGHFRRDSIVIAGTPEQIVARLSELIPDRTPAEIVTLVNTHAAQAPMVESVPLVPYFRELRRRGLKIGLATNDAEAPARSHLAAVGAERLFDFIAGSDSGFGGKPAAGQILGFCSVTGLEPARVAMVGDSTHDLKAARAAGCLGIGVLTGLALRADLAPYADVILDHIGQIPEWLDQC